MFTKFANQVLTHAVLFSQVFRLSFAYPAITPSLPLPNHVIHQFPDPTWIENIAVRSNGQLLLNLLTTPDLYLLDPFKPDHPVHLYSFPRAIGLLGIAELHHDVFYIVAGNFTIGSTNTGVGSYSVWMVDLSDCDGPDFQHENLFVKKVADIPEAAFLNGMTVLSRDQKGGTVIIADSALGVVWQLDVTTGKYSILLDLPEMKPPPPPTLALGINGVKILNGYLYWTNSIPGTFCRVKIDQSGNAEGVVDVLKTGFGDDFIFDREGNAYIAQGLIDVIGVVPADFEEIVTVEGTNTTFTVAGGTACKFGRTPIDRDTLYVVTSGGLAAPINGTLTEGGKVVAIDTRGFRI